MASIKGRYEYDDDGLTPGKKKEGGLHQNLFDGQGNLKGNARFIPDEDQEESVYDPGLIYDPDYMRDEDYERQREREQQENAELIAKVIQILVAEATPHAKRFWVEKARPAIEASKARRAARKAIKAAAKQNSKMASTVVDSSQESVVASEEDRPQMSRAEAQTRYLAALTAKAFSDQQMDLIANANVVDDEILVELERMLAELPPQQRQLLIEAAETNRSVLNVNFPVGLRELLGLNHSQADRVEIEDHRDR